MDLCCEICGGPVEWKDEVVRLEGGEARGSSILRAFFGYFTHSPARAVIHVDCLQDEDVAEDDSFSQICRTVCFNAAGVDLQEVERS